MAKAELTRDAERDLIDIYLHGIERFGSVAAERYASALAAKIKMVAEHPSFGADYNFVRPGLRRSECISHSIYYHATPNGILVLRILHGRMDAGRHLA